MSEREGELASDGWAARMGEQDGPEMRSGPVRRFIPFSFYFSFIFLLSLFFSLLISNLNPKFEFICVKFILKSTV